jgi:competence protein ComEC
MAEQGYDTRERPQSAGYRAGAASLWKRLGWRLTLRAGTLRDWLEAELAEGAGFQWLAVAFGLGCLIYFALPSEPLLAALLPTSILAGTVAFRGYHRGTSWRIAALIAVTLAGTTAAKLRVDTLNTPHVERDQYAELTARVIDGEQRVERRPRIVLDQIRTPQLPPDETPRRIRITVAERYGLPPLGSTISLRAQLMPVAEPVVPGGYDARRAAYFEGISASGFAYGGWQVVEPPHHLSPDLFVSRVRAAMVARIMAAEPGEAGAVAAALLVGERSALSEETNESLRISGLAHILSISGLHMMLIAGAAFVAVRALLALSPRLALTKPIRKWAAIAALIVVTIYLTLSGGGSATVRAYVMAAIMFAAILLDRPAISMRNLAVAAFVVLAIEPESIVEPGFQMSFAAVAGLIAAWEVWSRRQMLRLTDDDALPGLRILRWGWRALFGIALTTLIAGAATAPFAAYHFERVASYSLLGNLLAGPIVSIIIMPCGLATLIAMPVGLEALPLWPMARGIEMLLAVSDWVAGLPGADISAPAVAPLSLFLIAAGLLWLCLWRLRWRLFGVPAVALGVTLVPVLTDLPDILVAPDGAAVAVRDASGVLRVSGSRADSFIVEQFFDEEPGPVPDADSLREGVRCDSVACLLTAVEGLRVSQVLDPAAFPEDCRRADIIATPLMAPADCAAPVVIDVRRLDAFGAHAVRIEAGSPMPSFAVETERSAFPRPWQKGASSTAD